MILSRPRKKTSPQLPNKTDNNQLPVLISQKTKECIDWHSKLTSYLRVSTALKWSTDKLNTHNSKSSNECETGIEMIWIDEAAY